ncbi:MAG: hypothetical protein CME65_08480 [Halobacteriovoraceae bacterium]|nr:hypothetical protein [Halobacteriovoraceae bacterium]|tara:strand:+ start:3313 stop:3861 length:549 start_codon:yes stop_codon:yes gene_type:complete
MQLYYEIFASDRYVRVSPLYNIITVFDSVSYSRNDYDILSAPQRNHIGLVLESQGHKRLTGNSFQNIKSGQFLKFVTTRNLGVSPLYALEEVYNHDDIFIVTPGTYFLFLLMKHDKFQDKEILRELMLFISVHPVNLQQLLDLSRHDSFFSFFKSEFSRLKDHQEKAIAENLKDKRSLGSIF